MGFSSFVCTECSFPITHGEQDDVDDDWRRVVLVGPDDTTYKGLYDGYGRINEEYRGNMDEYTGGTVVDNVFDQAPGDENPRIVHDMCYEQQRFSELEPSPTDPGQGLPNILAKTLMERYQNNNLDVDLEDIPVTLDKLDGIQYTLPDDILDPEDQIQFVLDYVVPELKEDPTAFRRFPDEDEMRDFVEESLSRSIRRETICEVDLSNDWWSPVWPTGTTEGEIIQSTEPSNNRTALVLRSKDGQRLADLTVNRSDEPIGDDELIINNPVGDEGVLEPMVEEGIVSEPERTVQLGFNEYPVCEYKAKPDEQNESEESESPSMDR